MIRPLFLAVAAVALLGAQPGSDLRTLNESFVALAARITPSVVQVTSDGYSGVPGRRAGVSMRQSTGSGFVLSAAGHIVTNAHVVAGASRVQVTLPTATSTELQSIVRPRGRNVPARVLGIDSETDIAVLQVEAGKLTALELADSDTVKQGQIVLALGNPLGLDNSVSMGVVSAVARQLEPESPVIYIQTDASINPGNSGGPMVDVEGRVVGINTIILSQSGGSEGLGFAVPSNIVKSVASELIKNGAVTRGEIGLDAQTITPALAAGLGLKRTMGVVVADVARGGPAAFSAIQEGDVILTLDGKSMENARQFQVGLYSKPIRSYVELEIERGDQRLKKTVAVAERRDDPARFRSLVDSKVNAIPELGILAVPLDLKLTMLAPNLRRTRGILVASPLAEAPVAQAVFLPGDVIYAVNTRPVSTLPELQAVLQPFAPGEVVVVQCERGGKLRFVEVPVQ